MNKKMKKGLLTLLAMSLLGSSLVGCGKDEEVDVAVDIALSEKGQFPIVDEKITLTVFAPQIPAIEDLATNEFTKELEELTNIHIEWQTVPQAGLNEKRSLMLGSNSYPDILLGASITKEEEVLYGTQGTFIPLNDLISEHCVELPKLFDTIDWLKPSITTPDGNIYSLPHINEAYHVTMPQKMWLNQEWLDTLGLKMPTTTEEFEQVLLAFKTQDPNGNGKADEIPLSGSPLAYAGKPVDFLMNAFVYYQSTGENDYRIQLQDGKVDFVADAPEFKEGLTWMKSLYDQDLIDPAAFTQPTEQYKQLGENPDTCILGAGSGLYFGNFTSLSGERSKIYEPCPPLAGPNGVQTTAYNPFGMSSGAFAITDTNPYPEASIKLVDYLYSEIATRSANEGRKGQEWFEAEEGQVGINGKPAKWYRDVTWGDVQNVCWVGLGAPGAVTADYRLSEVAAADPYSTKGFETRLYNATKLYEPYKPTDAVPLLYMTTESIDEMAQLKQPILNYVDESIAKFITGEMDIEADWEQYIKGLEQLGLERYEALLQEAYDLNSNK